MSVWVHRIAYACWPPAAALSPSSVFWVGKRGWGVCVGFSEHKMKKNRQQAYGNVLPLNWSSPLSRRCTMCAYVLQYVSPSSLSLLLIGSFSPLINSVNAGWAEPSWDKHSSIDQYLKQLTYPSVYMGTDIWCTKGRCVISSLHPLWFLHITPADKQLIK